MSTIVTLNGVPYIIPDTGEVGWGQQVHNYLVALGSGGVLTLDGGSFPLINEVNFGPTYGLASPYFRSGQDPAATTGVLRLTNSEGVYWRNAADTANLGLTLVGDQLYFAGNPIGGGGSPLITKGDLYTFSTVNARLPVGLNGQVLTADSSASTGLSWQNAGGGGGGSVVGFTFTNANGISGSVATPTTTPNLTLSLGAITPTSVAASGTVTGSNLSGTSSGTNTGDQTITLTGDVTGSGTGSFATTYNGVVPIAKGGTGQTTANAAFNALAPTQTGNNGKVLITDGSNTSWAAFPGAGSVTSVSGTAANGTIVTVSNPTTTPNITVGLGNITPTSVAASGTVTGSNISGTSSGTNTGDQTITLTGDVTGTGTGSFVATLANTAVVPGTYGSGTTMPVITVDSKGRITAVTTTGRSITMVGDVTGSGYSPITMTLANTGVTPGTYNNVTVNAKGLATAGSNVAYLTANQNITISGDATGSGTTAITLTLANTAVSPGSYTKANVTVDSKGRITGISNGSAVTSVSVVTANGVSGSVANPTTTPAITLTLGNITPTSVKTTTLGGIGEAYSATHSVDASLYNISKFTLTGNDTIPKPTNIPSGVAYTVTYFITQNASSTVTWFSTIKWRSGVPPVMTAIAGISDIFILTTFDAGTNWFGTAVQGYA